MRFKTVREILDFVRDFHARAAQLYTSVSGAVPSKRLHWLLRWLADHEQRLASAVERYEAEPGNATMLNEWLRFVPEPGEIPLKLPTIGSDMSEDDALVLALALDEYLVNLFEKLMRQTESEHVRDLLQDMLSQERAAEQALSRGFNSMRDV